LVFENGEIEIEEIFGFESKRTFLTPKIDEKRKLKFFFNYECESFVLISFFHKKISEKALSVIFLVLTNGELYFMHYSESPCIFNKELIFLIMIVVKAKTKDLVAKHLNELGIQ